MDHNFKASRPHDMRMNIEAFQETFSIKLPSVSAEISKAAAEFFH